ncbi:hypothetical protein BUALT_Bualt16G0006500 [Buddleja alternifolia]|uniref:Ubiquitin-like domain-containing protein n=1 Tax=Buddleja alternifolia TaxID=168488 RepID=A0AAV6WIK0_9LAMI|nr:hypothetical protein BUALT_Bualt16G0006500 [Buddleja alternifolia]
MIKLRSKRFSRSSSKLGGGDGVAATNGGGAATGEIKWELRPGGMLVQKRENNENPDEVMIKIRVSTVSQWHDISPQEQRLLFKGKEREDHEHLHMLGVRDNDKVLMLEDPAIKERKLLGSMAAVSPSERSVVIGQVEAGLFVV